MILMIIGNNTGFMFYELMEHFVNSFQCQLTQLI